jgi:hypothetical protein
VSILSWTASYDVKPDGFTLVESSGKKYLEDLLMTVRHSLERRRNESSSSASSVISGKMPPLESSTPLRARSDSMEEDMR